MTLQDSIKNEAKILLQTLTASREVPFWFECRKTLLTLIINENLDTFLDWRLLRETMYVVNTDYSKKEYNFLMQSKNYIKWSYAILDAGIGNPVPSSFFSSSNDNTIHTAYHLASFEEKTGSELKTINSVLEFGGGYGCMAALWKKLNYCTNYVVYDFPEFNLLQKYYLLSNGIEVATSLNDYLQKGGVYLTSDINEVKSIKEFDLLIGTWSLSETPIDFRNEFLQAITVKNYLLAYQKQFDDADSFYNVNNDKFFTEMSNNIDLQWHNFKIEHLFNDQFYLFGTK